MNKCDNCAYHQKDKECEMIQDTKSWNPFDENYEVVHCTDYKERENNETN